MPERLRLPVPRLVLRPRRQEHVRLAAPRRSPSTTWQPDDIDLVPVRCEMWGGCAWINLDDNAPPLRECIEPFGDDPRRVEGRVVAHRVVVRVPPAGELEARGRSVRRAVPRCRDASAARDPARYAQASTKTQFDPRAYVDAELQYLHTMSDGMAGMVHADDVRDRRRTARHRTARGAERGDGNVESRCSTTRSSTRHRDRGPRHSRSQRARSARARPSRWATASRTSSCCPMYSSASSYRFRPLGPEETLMEIWSLTRYPEGRGTANGRRHPSRGSATTRAGRRSPRRTSRTCPDSRRACTRKGFEYMRLSERGRGPHLELPAH